MRQPGRDKWLIRVGQVIPTAASGGMSINMASLPLAHNNMVPLGPSRDQFDTALSVAPPVHLSTVISGDAFRIILRFSKVMLGLYGLRSSPYKTSSTASHTGSC